jgi:hypothetical protein
MDRSNKYRKLARDAQTMADEAGSPEDKASWRSIAQSWLDLLRGTQQPAEQRFDDQSKARGTGQDESGSTH